MSHRGTAAFYGLRLSLCAIALLQIPATVDTTPLRRYDPSVISIVIPSFNAERLLRRNLPGVLGAVKAQGAGEVIVVDDGSEDGSLQLLRSEFPVVRVVAMPENVGFGPACMAGIHASKGDIVYLLNTDVSVDPSFLGSLIESMADDDVFAVSSVNVLAGSPETPSETRHPHFRKGFFMFYTHAPQGEPPYETFFAPGGYSAFRKDRFLQIGGFDPLFEPFYWEDVDLSYRALKRGWRILVDPRSRIRHEHGHSVINSKWGRARAEAALRRNRFLFMWKNVTSVRMLLLRHCVPSAVRLLLGWMALDIRYYLAFGRALGRIGMARKRRRDERAAQRVTDEEIFVRLRPNQG